MKMDASLPILIEDGRTPAQVHDLLRRATWTNYGRYRLWRATGFSEQSSPAANPVNANGGHKVGTFALSTGFSGVFIWDNCLVAQIRTGPALWEGRKIRIAEGLPETLMTLMAGRDAATIIGHPAAQGRTIEKAEKAENGNETVITLTPRDISIDRLHGVGTWSKIATLLRGAGDLIIDGVTWERLRRMAKRGEAIPTASMNTVSGGFCLHCFFMTVAAMHLVSLLLSFASDNWLHFGALLGASVAIAAAVGHRASFGFEIAGDAIFLPPWRHRPTSS